MAVEMDQLHQGLPEEVVRVVQRIVILLQVTIMSLQEFLSARFAYCECVYNYIFQPDTSLVGTLSYSYYCSDRGSFLEALCI